MKWINHWGTQSDWKTLLKFGGVVGAAIIVLLLISAMTGCESRSGGELGRLDVRGISGFRGPRPVIRLVRGGVSVRVLNRPCTLKR